MTYELKLLPLSAIRTNGGTQTRVQLNAGAVKEYGEAMTEGVRFPPVIVFFDGAEHWLADGFHRVQASMDIGALSIEAEVRSGDQRAARLFSTGANGAHGVPPTAADKRRAVMTLLEDAEWGDWSDREMARQCKVSPPFVAKTRRSLETFSDGQSDSHLKTFSDSRPESHLGELPDSPAQTVKKVSRGGKTYEMKTDGVSKASKARAQKSDKPTVATAPEKHDETPGPVERATDDEEDSAFDAQMLADFESTLAENVELQKIVNADPPLAEAVARIKQLSAEVFALRASVRGLQSEKNEAIRLCKAAQRRADRLEKAAKVQAE